MLTQPFVVKSVLCCSSLQVVSGLTGQQTLSPLYTYRTASQNSVGILRILHHHHMTDQDIIQSNYNKHKSFIVVSRTLIYNW